MALQIEALGTLSRLLDTALSLPTNAREAWLASLSPDHAVLRPLLRQLLTQADLGERAPFLATLPKIDTGPTPVPDVQAGDSIGPYRLEKLLGSGGMGSVWLAVRTDSLKRTVALKLPHFAAASAGLAERMARERNILAKLEHPNIARLYDAGVTREGRPYLALEYVEGAAIDVYCRTHGLGIRPRVELLTQVARAVAYAHAHLIVHRDLKPSNVLVDSEGQVHLLDFGIATLLTPSDGGGIASEALTRQLGPALTPHYAAPEQLRGEPVSTGSDVYALGVLSYELMTDRRPYEFKDGDLFTAMHTVIEAHPPLPSRVAGTAEARRLLRGDLDTIVLKAMHKQTQARYATALEFVDDLQRYLRAEPVRARPDSLSYRAAKFVQRNRVAALSIALIAISLCVGISGTLWQAGRALRGERQARAAEQRAERRFEDVRSLTHSLLFDYHDAIKNLPGATPVRARLVRDALGYVDRLAHEAEGDIALEQELASAYERLGDIQGGTMEANLGDTSGALASQQKALALRERIATARPTDPAAQRALALDHRRVGVLLWETGDVHKARAEVEMALKLLTAAGGVEASDQAEELAKTEDYLGRVLLEEGDSKGAREHFTASTQILQRLLAATPNAPGLLKRLSTVYEQAGSAADFEGDLGSALAYHQDALKLRERLSARAPLNADYRRTVAVSWYNIGEILAEQGRPRPALDAYRRSSAISEKLVTADAANQEYRGDLAYAELRVGDMLLRIGSHREATAAYQRSRELREADVRADPTNLWKRSSLIEVHAKLSKALSKDQPAPASNEADLARSLMEATTVDPQNAAILSFFAQTYADLGDVYRALSAGSRGDRAGGGALADKMYDHAEEIWRGMEDRGMLSSSDRKRRAELKTVRPGA
jgi:non-specific serine/threonine protein kinase/serine/threonine-protein kinase